MLKGTISCFQQMLSETHIQDAFFFSLPFSLLAFAFLSLAFQVGAKEKLGKGGISCSLLSKDHLVVCFFETSSIPGSSLRARVSPLRLMRASHLSRRPGRVSGFICLDFEGFCLLRRLCSQQVGMGGGLQSESL